MTRLVTGFLSVIVNRCVCLSVTCRLGPRGSPAESWMALLVVVRLKIRNKDSPVNPNFSATASLCMWPSTFAFQLFFFSEPFSPLLVPALPQNYHTFELRELGRFPRNTIQTTKQVADLKPPKLEHTHTQTICLRACIQRQRQGSGEATPWPSRG